jgi:anti-anti-sigma factor
MRTNEAETLVDDHFECPVCGNSLPHEPSAPRFDAPCYECGYRLWCRTRLPSDRTVLEVLPNRTPEPWEVKQLIDALVNRNAHERVVIDLSRLDMVDSSLVARFVSMNRRIRESGGQLILTGMCPLIRETFRQLRLDRAFDIAECDA